MFSSNVCTTPFRWNHLAARWRKLQDTLGIESVKFHAMRSTFPHFFERLKNNAIPTSNTRFSIIAGYNISVQQLKYKIAPLHLIGKLVFSIITLFFK